MHPYIKYLITHKFEADILVLLNNYFSMVDTEFPAFRRAPIDLISAGMDYHSQQFAHCLEQPQKHDLILHHAANSYAAYKASMLNKSISFYSFAMIGMHHFHASVLEYGQRAPCEYGHIGACD